jgi:NADPH2:quinone reductase
VGRDTFEKGFNCLAMREYMVLYGASSGPVGAFDPQVLNAKGSLFLTRPSLFHYTASREDLVRRAGDVLGWIQKGELTLRIGATFPLAEAAQANRDLEGRRTTGQGASPALNRSSRRHAPGTRQCMCVAAPRSSRATRRG